MASEEPSGPGPSNPEANAVADPDATDPARLDLLRRPASRIAGWAARAGLAPSLVTVAAAIAGLLVFLLFWTAHYWWGLLCAFAFASLERIAAMLAHGDARRSNWAGHANNALDLVAPPLWWWAWEHGLAAYGRPLAPVYATMVLGAIVGGYCAERAIAWLFARRFGGTSIGAWRPVDSRFGRIGAARNPNVVILAASLLFARPDVGLELVAWWTIVSLIFHAVRMAQASEQEAGGQAITSWLQQ